MFQPFPTCDRIVAAAGPEGELQVGAFLDRDYGAPDLDVIRGGATGGAGNADDDSLRCVHVRQDHLRALLLMMCPLALVQVQYGCSRGVVQGKGRPGIRRPRRIR